MTKGTTWVVAIAMLIVFFIAALINESRMRSRWFACLLAASAINCMVSIQFAGYDFEHYDVYANRGRGQPLYVWEKTNVGRPGVPSVVDGYLTFRLLGLIADPQITNGREVVQQHRTSVWTQIYAQANFAQFEQHPKSWLTTDRNAMHVARACFILGLMPLLFLLVGLCNGAFRSLRAWRCWGMPPQYDYAALFNLLVCSGYIGFIIKFTADYRDFAAMKLIYMLPGILPFAIAIVEGMQWVADRTGRIALVERTIHAVVFLLLVLHCAGIVALIEHLASPIVT